MALINNATSPVRIRGINNLSRLGVYRVINRNYYIWRLDGNTSANLSVKYWIAPFPFWNDMAGGAKRLASTFIISPTGGVSTVYNDLENWANMEFEFIADSVDIVIPGSK